MTLNRAGYLFDVNVLVALTDKSHIHHSLVTRWFNDEGSKNWGVCSFTEAGFLRVVTRPAIGALRMEEATEILRRHASHPGYRFWTTFAPWISLSAPFEDRIFGHQQITDVYLLGLAVKEGGVLVTLDKAIRHLAREENEQNLLVLQ